MKLLNEIKIQKSFVFFLVSTHFSVVIQYPQYHGFGLPCDDFKVEGIIMQDDSWAAPDEDSHCSRDDLARSPPMSGSETKPQQFTRDSQSCFPPFARPDHLPSASSEALVTIGYEGNTNTRNSAFNNHLIYFSTNLYKSDLVDASLYPVQYQYTVTGKTRKKENNRYVPLLNIRACRYS